MKWVCARCHKPAATGYLTVNEAKANQQPAGTDVIVPWLAYHYDCDPLTEEDGYAIALELIGTLGKAAGWTQHLAAKRWLLSTDWFAVIAKAAHPSAGAEGDAE